MRDCWTFNLLLIQFCGEKERLITNRVSMQLNCSNFVWFWETDHSGPSTSVCLVCCIEADIWEGYQCIRMDTQKCTPTLFFSNTSLQKALRCINMYCAAVQVHFWSALLKILCHWNALTYIVMQHIGCTTDNLVSPSSSSLKQLSFTGVIKIVRCQTVIRQA